MENEHLAENEESSQLLEDAGEKWSIDLDERDQLLEVAKRQSHGGWVQEGIWIKCTVCPNQHGFYIGTGLMLVGTTKDGKPKFKKIKIDNT